MRNVWGREVEGVGGGPHNSSRIVGNSSVVCVIGEGDGGGPSQSSEER